MWVPYYLQQAHFGISILTALAFFSISWLYLDAWSIRRMAKEGIRTLGFILLSLSWVIAATVVETSLLPVALFGVPFQTILLGILRIGGYLLIQASFFIDPIQKKPMEEHDEYGKSKLLDQGTVESAVGKSGLAPVGSASAVFFGKEVGVGFVNGASALQPLGAAAVAGLYLHRARAGLERHLFPVGVGFLFFTAYELLGLLTLLRGTSNVALYGLVLPFGPMWLLQHLTLAIGTCVLFRWIFGYLLKRFETQLFIIFVSIIVVVYLLTTVTFTSLLLSNMSTETLRQLDASVRVLAFGLESKKEETHADAAFISQQQDIRDALGSADRARIADVAQSYLLAKKLTTLVVVDERGRVVARGEDRERFGDSLAGDAMIARALKGEAVSSVISVEGVFAPEISIQSAAPILHDETVVGVVLAGEMIDSAFVDGIKKATGLEGTIFGGAHISATTLTGADGSLRPLGAKEDSRAVIQTVLTDGKPYSGSVTFFNRLYLGAYVPIHDIDSRVIGMLFVGQPQTAVLAAAGKSIAYTFVAAVVLLVLSLFPTYIVSQYIVRQIR